MQGMNKVRRLNKSAKRKIQKTISLTSAKKKKEQDKRRHRREMQKTKKNGNTKINKI